jgi:hypothetical protein
VPQDDTLDFVLKGAADMSLEEAITALAAYNGARLSKQAESELAGLEPAWLSMEVHERQNWLAGVSVGMRIVTEDNRSIDDELDDAIEEMLG